MTHKRIWHNSVLCSVRSREKAPARAARGAVGQSWGVMQYIIFVCPFTDYQYRLLNNNEYHFSVLVLVLVLAPVEENGQQEQPCRAYRTAPATPGLLNIYTPKLFELYGIYQAL